MVVWLLKYEMNNERFLRIFLLYRGVGEFEMSGLDIIVKLI